MGTKGIKLVELQDFEVCPIWRYDEDDDLYFPVMQGNDLPESERDVCIFVECKANSQHRFKGYVVGIGRVFSMGLFCHGKTFYLNSNVPDLSIEQMRLFLECADLAGVLTVPDLFPLEYATQIKRDGFRDFSGKFEITFG